jgi:hypothetical protein
MGERTFRCSGLPPLARGCTSALLMLLFAACTAALSGCGNSLNNQFELMQKEQSTGAGLVSAPGDVEGKSVRLPRSADALTSSATPGSTTYKIGPADVLDVSVFKVPELARTVLVDDAGAINMPLLGDVPAAG